MKKYWFKRKLYGWGWTAATWEGWLVILIYLALVTFLSLTMGNDPSADGILKFFVILTILTAVLIAITYKTGEKPCWQWGKRKEDETKKL